MKLALMHIFHPSRSGSSVFLAVAFLRLCMWWKVCSKEGFYNIPNQWQCFIWPVPCHSSLVFVQQKNVLPVSSPSCRIPRAGLLNIISCRGWKCRRFPFSKQRQIFRIRICDICYGDIATNFHSVSSPYPKPTPPLSRAWKIFLLDEPGRARELKPVNAHPAPRQ